MKRNIQDKQTLKLHGIQKIRLQQKPRIILMACTAPLETLTAINPSMFHQGEK